MNRKTTSVCFCRARLPHQLAGQLMALPRGLRGRTIAFVLLAHTMGLDVQKMIQAAGEMRRLGVLLNQSLRVSRGSAVDTNAVHSAVRLIGGMFP
jgi:hypothetical protein